MNAQGISRRNFLTGAMAIGATTAIAAVGCTPASKSTDPETESTWRTAPDPIDESQVTETISTELLVIGAGDSGLMASLAASEKGAKVVTIDKHSTFMAHGVAHACLGTKVGREMGFTEDVDRILQFLTIQSNNRADQRLLRLWAANSGRVYDEVISIAQEGDLMVIPMTTFGGGDESDACYPEYISSFMFRGTDALDSSTDEGQIAQTWLFRLIENKIKNNGGDIRYQTTAKQLVQDSAGRVTGIIATNSEGKYIKITASKGVILCTGDYGNDPEMVAEFCPWQTQADVNFYAPPINTGDGHKMGVWIGAAMQPAPHCPALHPERIVGVGEPPMCASPVLRVNKLGLRYENEQIPAPLVCEGRIRQPGNIAWAIFDANWMTDAPKMSPGLLRTPAPDESSAELLEANALKANTLAELATKMGVPSDTFQETVARYTELAEKGVDEDFGKSANNLWPIKTAPFYAIEVPTGTMNTLGGLLINEKMQVVYEDDQTKPIPGLYAAGNVSGGFYGSTYPSVLSGINKGWAIVGGYLAGENAIQ